MKKKIIFSTIALLLTSCSHPGIGRLVGGNRDEHGCLAAAGYVWSDARHDCVRVWEVGERFDEGPNTIFLIYSTDSLYAEIFTHNNRAILCRREKDTHIWRPSKGKEHVSINNGVTTIRVNNFDYTKSTKNY